MSPTYDQERVFNVLIGLLKDQSLWVLKGDFWIQYPKMELDCWVSDNDSHAIFCFSGLRVPSGINFHILTRASLKVYTILANE